MCEQHCFIFILHWYKNKNLILNFGYNLITAAFTLEFSFNSPLNSIVSDVITFKDSLTRTDKGNYLAFMDIVTISNQTIPRNRTMPNRQ